ncbi:hypothetical protein WR25_12672 [Diploscapter pachys]|uniref:Uncharacterized protein n=1 Tax=Diploscapter pachys TaxID=2018661 RepID=A0A2A2K8N0_9BILA|nr:hypothetical protein WR25_12672 [Diploscapter pachys]
MPRLLGRLGHHRPDAPLRIAAVEMVEIGEAGRGQAKVAGGETDRGQRSFAHTVGGQFARRRAADDRQPLAAAGDRLRQRVQRIPARTE